jgi:hypothetical protein
MWALAKEHFVQSAFVKDDLPMPTWIALMILGYVLFWPLGLVVLTYLIWSGKMMCCFGGLARSKSDGLKRWAVPDGEPRSTGNMAFDEYREATLKRLEEERVEFTKFLERLRHAKDKAEFDQFMSEQAVQRSQE